VNGDEIERELAALTKDVKDLRDRLEARRDSPVVEGDAIAAIRREDFVAMAAEADRIMRRTSELKAALENIGGRVTRRQWARGAVLGVVGSLVAVVVWRWLYVDFEPVVRLNYFVVSAQVIPVLVLGAALERQYFDVGRRKSRVERGYRVVTLLWLMAGEAAAMAVLLEGRVTALAFALTTNALVIVAMLVIIMAVGPWAAKDVGA
jgi:hypothetical protein